MNPDQPTKKKKRWWIIVLLIIAILVGVWFLFLRDYLSERFDISPDNLFPFGNPSNRIPTETTPTNTTPGGGGITEDTFQPLYRDRLRVVAPRPTSGFTALPTDQFYPSQASLALYNASRGEEDIDSLPVLRAPKLRHVFQGDHTITDTVLATSLSDLDVAETFIPNPYETLFMGQGRYFITRLYNYTAGFIETFSGRMQTSSLPQACEIPTNLSFAYGDTHPGIKGVKTALDELYGYQFTENDTFDSSLATVIRDLYYPEVDSETASQVELESVSITPETLAELRDACVIARNTANESLPLTISGNFLEANIDYAIQNPSGLDFITIQRDGVNGPYVVANYDIILNESETLLESQFGEWLAQWANNETLLLQTKPSQLVNGYAYILDTATGRMDKILGDKAGLLALMSPDGTKLVYSATNNNNESTETWLLDITTRQERRLSIRTLPDKCAWSTDSTKVFCGVPNNGLERGEPDLWFQGRTSYSDSIWMISLDGSTRLIYNMQTSGFQELDVYKMQYDPFEGNYLYFLDKNTNYLWSLEIDGLDE